MTQANTPPGAWDPGAPYGAAAGQTAQSENFRPPTDREQEYWAIVAELIENEYTPLEARQIFNRGLETMESPMPGAEAATYPGIDRSAAGAGTFSAHGRSPAAPHGPRPAPPMTAAPATSHAAPGDQPLTRQEFDDVMAHQHCVNVLRYDAPTAEIARAWVTQRRAQAAANGIAVTIPQGYQAFDHWRRTVAGRAGVGQPGSTPAAAGEGTPTVPPAAPAAGSYPAGAPGQVVTYQPPTPGAPPPAPAGVGSEPGVVPSGPVPVPGLPAGMPEHPGSAAISLEQAAHAREAARMAGPPARSGVGGAAPSAPHTVNPRFEELGLTDPHGDEYLEMVDDTEVQRHLSMVAPGVM